MLHIPGLYLLENDKGRGVYTAEPIEIGDVIEVCPIIKVPTGQLGLLDKTILYEYYFIWEEEGFQACLALGYGSLYNHSTTANADVLMDYQDGNIKIIASDNIKSGSEILIDYTGGIQNRVKLWFEVIP